MQTKFPLIIFFLCLLGSNHIFSQKEKVIDSLTSVIESDVSSDKKLLAYKKIINQFLEGEYDYDFVDEYINEGMKLARKVNDEESELFIKSFRGDILLEKNDSDNQKKENIKKAIILYQEILSISEVKDYHTLTARMFNLIGVSYERIENIIEAKTYFDKSLTVYNKLPEKNKRIIDSPYTSLCAISFIKKDYDKSVYYAKKDLEDSKLKGSLSNMVNAYNYLGIIFASQGNYKDAIINCENAADISEQLGNKKDLASILDNIATIYLRDGQQDQSLKSYQTSLKLRKEIGDDDLINHSMYLLGHYFSKMGQKDSAVYYLNKSASYYKEKGNIEKASVLYNSLGFMYDKYNQIDLALKYYFEALKGAEKLKNHNRKGIYYGNISSVYSDQNQDEKAIKYLQKSLDSYILAKDSSAIAFAKNNLSKMTTTIGKYNESLKYAVQALNQYKVFKDSCNMANSYLAIGFAYHGLRQPDSALYNLNKGIPIASKCNKELTSQFNIAFGKNYLLKGKKDHALRFFEKTMQDVITTNDFSTINSVSKYLYPIYKESGQYEKAFEALDLYQSTKDSLFNESNTRALVQKEMSYNFDKQQQQAAFQRQQEEAIQQRKLDRNRWITYIAIIISLAFIGIAFTLYRNFKNKKKANSLLRSQNEEIARQKRALEELDESKSRLYANVSHELRTPLTLISSPIQYMLSSQKDPLSINQKVQLKMVERNAKQLKGLVNDILDLSKLESNKLELHEDEVAIIPFLRRVVSNFDSLTQHLDIHYKMTSDISEDTYVLLDRDSLEKVINNLLSNAIKHTPSGGSVTFSAVIDEDQLQFSVIDTGSGIPEEDLPYIFDRFFQSKTSDDSLQGGTGIGLALAKELVQLMNGEITVKSKLGEGSTFLLTLAYKAIETPDTSVSGWDSHEEEEEASELLLIEKDTAKDTHPYTVLIVEDHPDMQRFIQQLLDHKYHTFVANNGKQALSVLGKEKIDLVISDVMMPEMDGYELLQELKDHESYRHLPVVMLTALDNSDNRLQALTIGVDDYLSKPFSPEELMARVHNLLQRYKVRQIVAKEIQEEIKELQIGSIVSEELSFEQDIKQTDVDWLKEVEIIIGGELENTEFNIATLADKFFLSQRQFQRKIKRITGLTPKKFQQEVALQKGRELLELKTYRSVKAVAYTIGMSNVWRFSQLYEDRFGKKPSAYF
ncbi:tetratricopeptide repeat protein [Aquimarina sp. 2201CG14-23]|uniref:tetratricopeptide repeat protein n=1 Tax=Aquimarina mycalae TaxID=3040073 RepID=UPI002477CC58|nr:tetratricopeptide repeat protein [Aquimarina sp. 2201CG14-23]MDH7445939.1 tetratricopeptide repeat protein [Aquimarina sp. 2201CG14-23]